VKRQKILETLKLVEIKVSALGIPKEAKTTYPDWYESLVEAVTAYWTIYGIAQPSVWEHHKALGLDDLREVVLLRKKKRDIVSVWSKRPFKKMEKHQVKQTD
jgi:ribose 5-phosphate isomerase RpiB